MSIVSYKCPNCGGGLKYSPEKGFKCEYCLSVFTQEQLDEHYKKWEQSLDEQGNTPSPAASSAQTSTNSASADEDSALVYSCPSCGAQVITDTTTAATTCHYCHNPVVLSEKLSGTFKPDAVIPFTVSKEQAAEQFKKHCTGKTYLPKDFYSEQQIENLFGVYYPYWIVDSELYGRYNAVGEIDTQKRRGDDLIVDTTSYQVVREGDITLNDMTASAIKSADAEILKYILPFNMQGITEFSMTYLSGFRAEKRDLEQADVKQTVENTKLELTTRLLKQNVGKYHRIKGEHTDINTKVEKWRYALLPVWIVTYKYGDKTYLYGINGQTGKSFGELPVNKTKLAWHSVAIAIAAAVIVFIIMSMGGGA